MITKEVIRDIYKEYRKPNTNKEEMQIEEYIKLLSPHHRLKYDGTEIIFEDLDEFNPFRCILVRNLHGIIEFDKYIAFIFPNHILFLSKRSPELHVHFKPEDDDDPGEKKSFFKRLFS